MIQIPVYRAKKIDSDEYVIGFYVVVGSVGQIYNNDFGTFGTYLIEPSTLSIHFPDMIDSKGNRIFASLSEDGKGGDILMIDMYQKETICIYDKRQYISLFFAHNNNIDYISDYYNNQFKIVGVQQ